MRVFLLSLYLFSFSINTNSQSVTDTLRHLTFKGVPLDGALDQFVSKMKQSGFSHVSTNDGIAMLQGDFAGFKGCILGVSTLKQKDLVYKIGVALPNRDTWATLSGDYFELKQLLTEKYGTPTTIVEKFDNEYSSSDDNFRLHEVKFDNCKYYSIWTTDKGEIQVSIDHKKSLSCFVKLVYLDKINGATIRKMAMDDL